MSTAKGKIPKIPRIPKKVPDHKAETIVEEKKEFSGELEGGTLWHVLRVEESLLRNILLQLSPVDLINLEKTCVLMRDLIVQNKVWKNKLGDFSHLLASNEVKEQLELVVTEADEKYGGDVVKNENWANKLKYVHCWNLQLNWEKGQFLQSEISKPQSFPHSDGAPYGDTWPTVNTTNFSVIGHSPAWLFCHKSKTVVNLGVGVIENIIDVSPESLVIFGASRLKLVEKKSLKVLAECECEQGLETPSMMGDNIVLFDEDGGVQVFHFQVDPPRIYQEELDFADQQLMTLPDYDDSNLIEFSGHYCVDNAEYKLHLYKADFSNIAQKKNLFQKVWSLDISNQTSFPKHHFTSAMVDFPFMYVGKSNGMLEVWDVTKDEMVKTVDQTELLNAKTQSIAIDTIKQNDIGKFIVMNKYDIFVMDTNLLKSDTDSQLGYRLNYDVSAVIPDNMEVDSTCILVNWQSRFDKFDFWPICPDNFKLKPVKPDVEKKALVKAKKRADQSCSSSNYGQAKKLRGFESEDSDKDDDYEYLNDMNDFRDAADDDHEQFYDDDNDDQNDDFY